MTHYLPSCLAFHDAKASKLVKMVDPALMEARLRAYYAKYNPGNDQNMCVVYAYSFVSTDVLMRLHFAT